MKPHQRQATLLILDEGHRFTQEEGQLFNKVIDGTDFRFVMILSATFSPEQCKFMEDRGVPLIDEVTMEEAEECEYIAKLSKKVVYCNLFGESLRALNEVDEHYANSWSIFENKWDMVQNCLKPTEEGELARNYISRLKKIPPQNLFGLARTAMNAMSQRREFLQKASYKFDIIKDICELHKGQNIVTFGEHTDFVDQITDMLGKKARSYHSNVKSKKTTVTKTKLFKTERGVTSFVNKNKGKLALLEWEYDGGWYIAKWKVKKPVSGAKLKEQSMRDFETPGHPVTVLNTAKGLDEAANIKNVSVGIIWSFSSNPRQLTQRIGRICRWLEGKTAYVYVIVVKRSSAETQEQKWFRRATGYKEWDVLNDYELKRNVSPASGTN
jgi:superfamily II DNA or RNA helicase